MGACYALSGLRDAAVRRPRATQKTLRPGLICVGPSGLRFLYTWSVVSCQPSVVSCQLPVASCQLSVASCQLPVVSCQLSAVSRQLPVASCQLSVVSCQLSVVSRQSSVASCQLPVVSCQLPVVSCQLSVVSRQSSVASCQLPVVSCQLSAVSCQPSVVSCQLPSRLRRIHHDPPIGRLAFALRHESVTIDHFVLQPAYVGILGRQLHGGHVPLHPDDGILRLVKRILG